MAITDKLKVTRDQLAEFLENHNTIRQFERLFEYINTFVIPDPEVNTSNCFVEKYPIGDDDVWIANSDWTDFSPNIPHGLNANMSDLIVKLLISTDGTDANSFEILSTSASTSNSWGHVFNAVDVDNIQLQTGDSGLISLDSAGAIFGINTQSWYYKVVAWKFTILTEE